jgi:2-polyprenyl-6-methoxyphenol hydroxylase-like FAD-dependent oxidoreductase
MLGYLLARAGVPVTVLEKHGDFFRDFRGDTVHPSTLEVLYQLGLLDEFLKLPHQKVTSIGGIYGDFPFQAAGFRHLPVHAKFTALMPQWDFLNFLSDRARRFPAFDLRMHHDVVDLKMDGGRVTGVVARGSEGENVHIGARLVVGCDGRNSVTRRAGGLELMEFGVPIDVLWFRISRRPGDPDQVFGSINYGYALILINRGSYFQGGLIIRKGSFDAIKRRGLEEFRGAILRLAPYFDGRVEELRDWDQVKLLTVQIDRLRRWYRPGLLCIGDAAHAMSPAGGVGINLAIQDAVAAANLLVPALRSGPVPEDVLAAVQRRREFPARVTQAVQVNIHKAFARVFENPGPVKAPLAFQIAMRTPGVPWLLGYAVGMGVRPERVADVGGRDRGRRPALAIGIAAAIGAALAVLVARGGRRSVERRQAPVATV